MENMPAERLPGVLGCQRVLCRLEIFESAVDEDGLDAVAAVGEASIQGSDADAGGAGDLANGRADPVFGEHLRRGLDDPCPVALGVLAGCRHGAIMLRNK
jgi:hypothetical protein